MDAMQFRAATVTCNKYFNNVTTQIEQSQF